MRTQFFFNHPTIDDLTYASFALLKEQFVYIVGGIDFIKGSDEGAESHAAKPGHSTYIIYLPIYQR